MKPLFQRFLLSICLAATLISCSPPPPTYTATPLVQQRRDTLYEGLLKLLNPADAKRKDAQEEARWLSDTAYKAAAAISRHNDSSYPGWAGNALINMNWQDRGLCWHYQHDMYRELRRRPLKYFRIGTCVRQKGHRQEHNAVYITQKNTAWPHAWMLDAWMWNGRLKAEPAWELNLYKWEDLPNICQQLEPIYTEGHEMPIEHWYSVKCNNGMYDVYWSDDARRSKQYKRMFDKMQQGKTSHPNSPTTYQ